MRGFSAPVERLILARKRTIDPDFWTDEKVLQLPWPAVGFAVGLIQFADDEGRLEWSVAQLTARICGSRDDATKSQVRNWMGLISAVGLVKVYQVGNRTYAYHPAWERHQYVNKPQKSRYPDPLNTSPTLKSNVAVTDDSVTSNVAVTEDYVTSNVAVTEDSVTSTLPARPRARGRSDSDSDSSSNSVSGGSVGILPPETCPCEASTEPVGGEPAGMAPLFLRVYANRHSAKSQKVALAAWTAVLREMRQSYSWEHIWAAFRQTHRDANHAPFHAFGAVWSNLRAANGRPTPLRAVSTPDPTDAFRRV